MDKPKRQKVMFRPDHPEIYDADDMDAWLRDEVRPVLIAMMNQWKYYHVQATGGEVWDCVECGMIAEDAQHLLAQLEEESDGK